VVSRNGTRRGIAMPDILGAPEATATAVHDAVVGEM
jgi:hypothetical protein